MEAARGPGLTSRSPKALTTTLWQERLNAPKNLPDLGTASCVPCSALVQGILSTFILMLMPAQGVS